MNTFTMNSSLFYVYGPDAYSLQEHTRELEDDLNKKCPDGYWEIDHTKLLEILAKAWVDCFSTRLKEQQLPGVATYTGHWSPREYNFKGDEADFDFKISDKGLNALHERVTKDREAFAKYLKDYHSSYPGYRSYCTNDFDKWDANFLGRWSVTNIAPPKEFEKTLWQALDFLMWPTENDREIWNDFYTTLYLENGFEDAWVFTKQEAI